MVGIKTEKTVANPSETHGDRSALQSAVSRRGRRYPRVALISVVLFVATMLSGRMAVLRWPAGTLHGASWDLARDRLYVQVFVDDNGRFISSDSDGIVAFSEYWFAYSYYDIIEIPFLGKAATTWQVSVRKKFWPLALDPSLVASTEANCWQQLPHDPMFNRQVRGRSAEVIGAADAGIRQWYMPTIVALAWLTACAATTLIQLVIAFRVAFVSVRRASRRRASLCVACGYPLGQDRCPECGKLRV